MPRHDTTLAFIGGGPRTAGVLERLGANAPELLTDPLTIHVVEPFQAGSGRIWRLDQDPGLMLNSMAGDVTMFTDSSVVCTGPTADGPDLAQWASAITAGTLDDAPELPHNLAVQAAALTRESFPTRQLHSAYLEWFFRRAVAALAPHATVTIHRDTAIELVAAGEDGHVVALAGGTQLRADAVVLAVGHTDARVHGRSAEFATFAARHGGFHAAPSYTTDVDYSALAPGQDVIVSGMGLAFVDLVVLLMEGRGGRFTDKDDGELAYVPSGREPRLWAGSRRGVPYHSKISTRLRGEAPGLAPFFTAAAVEQLLAEHHELDFRTHLWPLIAKDTAHAYYQELFTGSPARVRTNWADFSAAFGGLDWYSPARAELVAAAVPDRSLWLDFEALDQPLAGVVFTDSASIAEAVASHIAEDLKLRDGSENPETLALFLGLLRAYMNFASIVPAERLTAGSHAAVHGWWHGFFSYVDSGPPPHRLRQILALHRAGLLEFLGPDLTVTTEEASGLFVAAAARGVSGVKAAAFIEARLPAPTVANSANPVLASLHASGGGSEQHLLTADGTVSTGRLLVTETHQLVGSRGERHETLFAVGPGTSAWASGAFARPHSNAAPFRDNDALARLVLHTLAEKADLTLIGRTQS
ncbi:FAD/NAD(P)-binding protein [Arthrobacter sp. TWP1-1]|uniref:FAD/NAD(P)-binding protein n=1 Tax=Arthrobacter sp. TWP1-1 TaxID=2804568 RepID=UPI003CED8096